MEKCKKNKQSYSEVWDIQTQILPDFGNFPQTNDEWR